MGAQRGGAAGRCYSSGSSWTLKFCVQKVLVLVLVLVRHYPSSQVFVFVQFFFEK